MARSQHKLTSAELRAKPPGKYADGGGLWFHRRADGGAQWFLRYTSFGRRHEMGLGSFPAVSLKDARREAEMWRAVVRDGKDAIKERERLARQAERNSNILRDIALDAFESRKAELRGDGVAGRWFSPLEHHVLPKLGKMPVSQIDQRDIRDTLAPIWHDKADTARKAINRLSIVLRHAAALGLDVDLQATAKARALLGRQRHTVTHIPAMDWREVPAFYQSLDGGTPVELALRLLILTGMRSKAVRFIQLDQIDGDVWTVPADLMKGRKGATKDFRVALSREAQAVIAEALRFARAGFLFPGVRHGVISDMTMSKFMDRRGLIARPHGFRTSLRVWSTEVANVPDAVAETAIGHVVGGAVERSYKRLDYLDQRQALMEQWAGHLLSLRSAKLLQLPT